VAISNEIFRRRVENVRQKMRDRELQALVVYAGPASTLYVTITPGNLRYLVGWADKFAPSLLVLPVAEEPALLVPGPSTRHSLQEIRHIWVADVQVEYNAAAYGTAALRLLQDRAVSPGRVGLLGISEMPTLVYEGLAGDASPWVFEDADDLVFQERIIKEPEEIDLHRAAANISDAMLYEVMLGARAPGKWAWQLMADVEYRGRSLGAELSSCWLSTGPEPDYARADLWEHQRQLQDDDRINAGTYVVYEGYWAHGLRMAIKGKATPELTHYVEAVREAQDAGIEALKPGRSLAEVYGAMHAVIEEHCPITAEEDTFRFRPGHGLGLDYAEPPITRAFPQASHWSILAKEGERKEAPLTVQPGMVLELHPNFTVPGLGMMCMGDVALVTPSGVELLTKIPRQLFEI